MDGVQLQGGSLLFTTTFPEIPGTHFIYRRRMKRWIPSYANLLNFYLSQNKSIYFKRHIITAVNALWL